MRRIPAWWVAAIVIQMFLAATAVSQNTIHVPADQPTIQQAINAAQNGDTVLVSPGTYTENIDFQGKAITVASVGGASVTTIDGGAKASVVTFQHGENSSSILNGFTITNGTSSFEGAGIMISSASPTIENNVITANHGCQGIGIAVAFASPIIQGNTISNNIATTCTGGDGGGISVRGSGNALQILNNTITGNQLPGGGDGGGIGLNGAGTATISGNIIQHNSVFNDGGGISLFNQSDPTIVQNLITDNVARGNGGGMFVSVPSGGRGPLLVNNTVANNTAALGSAVFSQGFVSNVQMINNLFHSQAAAAVDCDATYSATPPVLSFNDAFTVGGPGYIGSCSSAAGSNNNISQDPLFVNPATGDYHLQSGSPAVDAGNNSAPNLSQKDLDGNPRIAVGAPPSCTSTIDLGVYEFVLTNVVSLTPGSLAFGSLALGSSSPPQTTTVTATQGCVQVSSVSVSGDFAQTNNCPALLTSGNQCSVQVVFTPTAIGQRNGTLAVSGNFSGQATSLSGTGLGGILNVAPQNLAFADQFVNTSSPAQVVTVSNSGNASLQINSISASGDFAQTNNCPAQLAGGSQCSVQVVFTPTAIGPRSGTLAVSADSSGQTVALSGTGLGAILNVAPQSLAFANQTVNTSSAAQVVTVTNSGNAPLQISSISASGDFGQTNNCPSQLAGGNQCSVQVVFTPIAVGPRSGTLAVSTSSSAQTVGLSGTGLGAVLTVAPQALAFGGQLVNTSSAAQVVTVTNSGNAPLQFSAISISGDFTQNSNCGTSLASGSSCNINVSFTPSVAGPRSGNLSIQGTQPPQTQSVSLSGTGIDYSLVASPATATLRSGDAAQYSIIAAAAGGSFPNPVSFSCSGLPFASSCSFSPGSVIPGSSSATSILTISTTRRHGIHGTPAGTYNITVTGASGNLIHAVSVQLTVQ